ncbi:MAG TPA: DUF4114 domain-containing protein [Polyangia bacterium]|jgi:hypothetical protein|nr:DUF4114 domain-containing protein [Polyangia bacterium]
MSGNGPDERRAKKRTDHLLGLAALLALSSPTVAHAVSQPGGQVIPAILSATGSCDSGLNVQACLDDSEVSLGGAAGTVKAIDNATIDQETFDPGCQLTFKVLSKGGSRYPHAFGWYAVKGGNVPPALGDLNVFLTCMDTQTAGTTKTLTLPAGVGKIGFFMASYSFDCGALAANGTLMTEPLYTFYTERRFNGLDRTGAPIANVPPNVIRVLTWQSAATPGSFYFGWEDDGISSDNNFNDLVTRVGGISCGGGGASCDTGMKGACAAGTQQCRAGMLTCLPNQSATPESCNAIDDNCDGTVDEGDNLCPMGKVCFRGNCVPNCTQSEFYPCPLNFACDPTGICIETACKDITCPAGQLCRAGVCRGECEGIVCPYGQACRGGGCVDVCSTLKCDTGSACQVKYPNGPAQDAVGVCSNCPCGGCGAGNTCANNACVPTDCAAVSCTTGTHCQAGQCIDNCASAKCPAGSACDKGQCAMTGGGAGGQPGSTMGAPDGGGLDARADVAAGSGGTTPGSGAGASSGGSIKSACLCRVEDSGANGGALAAALLALAVSRARRRR